MIIRNTVGCTPPGGSWVERDWGSSEKTRHRKTAVQAAEPSGPIGGGRKSGVGRAGALEGMEETLYPVKGGVSCQSIVQYANRYHGSRARTRFFYSANLSTRQRSKSRLTRQILSDAIVTGLAHAEPGSTSVPCYCASLPNCVL